MSPIPGKGHDPKPMELTTKDGRRLTLKVGGPTGDPVADRPAPDERRQEPEGAPPASDGD